MGTDVCLYLLFCFPVLPDIWEDGVLISHPSSSQSPLACGLLSPQPARVEGRRNGAVTSSLPATPSGVPLLPGCTPSQHSRVVNCDGFSNTAIVFGAPET